jgi:LysR family transcriptional regulator, glycine cleavage system transcriptional activator
MRAGAATITISLDAHLNPGFKWDMSNALPPLDSLRVLVACARHGNFSRAAAELGVTPTAVSQRMRSLEAQIGVKLFGRHGPRLMTTDRARALAHRIEHALGLMRVAVDDCRRIKHPLRVSCAPTFAARWLVPRLAMYQTLAGADAIALDVSQTLLPPGAFDVAIRSGIGPWPGYTAARLLVEQGTPMISPRYVPGGAAFTVRKLLQLPLIPDPRWPRWFELAGLPLARPKFVAARFPNYELEGQAAVKGIGAALLSPVLFAELTAQGALVAPFPWVVEGPSSYWLLLTGESAESHFGRWVRSQFGGTS